LDDALIGRADDLLDGMRRIEECHAADARGGGPAVGQAEIRESGAELVEDDAGRDRKSTRLNSSHVAISYAVFCLKKKKQSEMAIGGGKLAKAWDGAKSRRVALLARWLERKGGSGMTEGERVAAAQVLLREIW